MNARVATAELPAASVPCALKMCAPPASGLEGVSLFPGPEHPPKLAVPVSIEHRNVTGPCASVPLKVKVGLVSLIVPVGPESMATDGGVPSTSKVCVAVAELEAASVAFTRKVYGPSVSAVPGVSLSPGPEHAPKLGVPVSIEHSKVTGPTPSVALKVKVGVVSLVSPVGPPSTVTSGTVESST